VSYGSNLKEKSKFRDFLATILNLSGFTLIDGSSNFKKLQAAVVFQI
jgi:hypothetical protein